MLRPVLSKLEQKINQYQEQQMCSSLMDQYFAPIPSTYDIRFCLNRERNTNRQENMRIPCPILSDIIINDFI